MQICRTFSVSYAVYAKRTPTARATAATMERNVLAIILLELKFKNLVGEFKINFGFSSIF